MRILAICLMMVTMLICRFADCGEIHVVVKTDDVAKVKALLTANPDLANTKDDKDICAGDTPLFLAANKEMAESLLAHGADVNARTHLNTHIIGYSTGDTAPIWAAGRRYTGRVRYRAIA